MSLEASVLHLCCEASSLRYHLSAVEAQITQLVTAMASPCLDGPALLSLHLLVYGNKNNVFWKRLSVESLLTRRWIKGLSDSNCCSGCLSRIWGGDFWSKWLAPTLRNMFSTTAGLPYLVQSGTRKMKPRTATPASCVGSRPCIHILLVADDLVESTTTPMCPMGVIRPCEWLQY